MSPTESERDVVHTVELRPDSDNENKPPLAPEFEMFHHKGVTRRSLMRCAGASPEIIKINNNSMLVFRFVPRII